MEASRSQGAKGRVLGAMSRLGSVQQKVPCLFVTQVKEEPSAKRERQVLGSELPAGVKESHGPVRKKNWEVSSEESDIDFSGPSRVLVEPDTSLTARKTTCCICTENYSRRFLSPSFAARPRETTADIRQGIRLCIKRWSRFTSSKISAKFGYQYTGRHPCELFS